MKKVLVIEDNENNLKLITYALKRFEHQVISAENGSKGIRLAIDENPDFIILDIDLPDIDGIQVAKDIKMNTQCQHIPLIAMTSYAMKGDREKILESGVSAYFEKPIDPLTVVQEIHQILGIES